MTDQTVQMNVEDTLELDYLVEQVSDNILSINKEPSEGASDIKYINRRSSIFNPSETEHTLSI